MNQSYRVGLPVGLGFLFGDGSSGKPSLQFRERLLMSDRLDNRCSVGNKSGMQKFFSLEAGRHKPARLADKIKSDVRKYLKRERGKELPEGVDFWDFDCRQGESAESAEDIHVKEIGKSVDQALEKGWKGIYLEILAKPGMRKAKGS